MQRPWDDAFALAWSSFLDATTPVGAVLLNRAGMVVATGQGRRYSTSDADGELSGSRLAHAELNALVGIDPTTHIRDHTLLTTVEPCSMCVGACIQARVGTVVHAGADPYGGATSMALDNHQTRIHRPRFLAEEDPEWRDLGAILVLLFSLDVRPNGHVVAAYRQALPSIADRAEDPRTRSLVGEAATAHAPWAEVREVLRR